MPFYLFESILGRDAIKRLGDETGKVDRLSSLPDSLLDEILLNLPTKDVVRTSVLSSRWRNQWRFVPRLDLDYKDFSEFDAFVSFVDSFLGFNSESCLPSVRLKYGKPEPDPDPDAAIIRRWINILVKRKVKHLHVLDRSWNNTDRLHIPPTVYTCESLVTLKLQSVLLANPPELISLPCLKVIELEYVECGNDSLAFQVLISGCPVLESLVIGRSLCDDTQVLRVLSKSLLSFTHTADSDDTVEDLTVAIDAPKLEYLRLSDHRVASFILNNLVSLVKADIDIVFDLTSGKVFDPNDLQKRSMIRKFLVGISNVNDLTISSSTLEVIYDYSRCEQLPLYRNLSFLRVEFGDYQWEMLPVFLESCPNLKSLVVGSHYDQVEGNDILFEPRSYLSSLEYVEIQRPLKGEAKEMELVSYLLEYSKILKNLTLCLDDSIKNEESVILREILNIPRLSSSCQVVVL
ncbi:unnamed protein product [Microthlaspi erraticum]|uniref:F-box domain-containing protein n=1 Tax=Microthlaspi erraticum TaxID=1685480 RepID=A0A6D2LCJ6_9BRAS|nr:unnamed protein product [Microthlaspi erraticum]